MIAASKITLKLRRLTHPAPERRKSKKQISSEKRKSFDNSELEAENSVCSNRSEESMGEEEQDHSPRRHSCWATDATHHEYFPPAAAAAAAITSSINNLNANVEQDNFGTIERLLDFGQQWRRNSVLPPCVQDLFQPHSHPAGHRRITLASLPLMKTPTKQATVTTTPTESRTFLESVTGRRTQFRRAWSLFSLTSEREAAREKVEKEPRGKKEKSHQRILRPPTRHYYRRGISGLPIQCSPDSLRLAV